MLSLIITSTALFSIYISKKNIKRKINYYNTLTPLDVNLSEGDIKYANNKYLYTKLSTDGNLKYDTNNLLSYKVSNANTYQRLDTIGEDIIETISYDKFKVISNEVSTLISQNKHINLSSTIKKFVKLFEVKLSDKIISSGDKSFSFGIQGVPKLIGVKEVIYGTPIYDNDCYLFIGDIVDNEFIDNDNLSIYKNKRIEDLIKYCHINNRNCNIGLILTSIIGTVSIGLESFIYYCVKYDI